MSAIDSALFDAGNVHVAFHMRAKAEGNRSQLCPESNTPQPEFGVLPGCAQGTSKHMLTCKAHLGRSSICITR